MTNPIMKSAKRRLACAALAVLWSATNIAQAQIQLTGETALELSIGGTNSNFIFNEIPNEFRFAHLAINQFNVFVLAPMGEEWSFNARVQFDIWGGGRLNPPRITLATILWQKPESPVSVSIGRFVMPFGLYPRRQLQSDNLFASAPLSYGYFVNISDKRGFWPGAGNTGVYGTADDVGLTTVYFGGYTTGASLNWILIPNALNIELAIVNGALSSQADYTNLANLAGVARLGFQPAIFWQQGISVSYGSFMQADPVNNLVRTNNPFEQYRQLVLGTDVILAYAFFELSGELIYSQWTVPRFTLAEGFATAASNSDELVRYTVSNLSGYVDFKFEPPFLTGTYLALRYERLLFLPYTDARTNQENLSWDRSVTRLSASIGVKFSERVLAKLAFADQALDGQSFNVRDNYTLRSIFVVNF